MPTENILVPVPVFPKIESEEQFGLVPVARRLGYNGYDNEEIPGGSNGVSPTQLADAVAVEATARTEGDTALSDRVTVLEDAGGTGGAVVTIGSRGPVRDHPGVADDFQRGDSSSLGGGWSAPAAYSIGTNALQIDNADFNTPAHRTAEEEVSSYQDNSILLGFGAPGGFGGVAARHQRDGAHNHYASFATSGADSLTLNAYALGGTNQSGTAVSVPWVPSTSQVFRLRQIAYGSGPTTLYTRLYDEASGRLLLRHVWQDAYGPCQNPGTSGVNCFNGGAGSVVVYGWGATRPDPAYNLVPIGNSITAGYGNSTPPFGVPRVPFGSHYLGQTLDLLGRDWIGSNLGVSGITSQQTIDGGFIDGGVVPPIGERLLTAFKPGLKNIALIFVNTNGIATNATAQAEYARTQQIAGIARGLGYDAVIVGTMLPRGAALEAARIELNGLLRASGDFDRVVDFGRIAEGGQAGGNFNQFLYPDTVHPNDLMSGSMRDVLAPSLLSLPA